MTVLLLLRRLIKNVTELLLCMTVKMKMSLNIAYWDKRAPSDIVSNVEVPLRKQKKTGACVIIPYTVLVGRIK